MVGCLFSSVLSVVASVGALWYTKRFDPGNLLSFGEVLKHLDTIASCSTVGGFLEAEGLRGVLDSGSCVVFPTLLLSFGHLQAC